ncbi:MAG: MBL fold metallo-hydrolase [Proteobacteria bacterium]|nr:MBL fold metallo-hydrolase [Pseudomonadota bacterium]
MRGSIPSPGRGTAFFGGNTTCVEIEAGSTRVICDAGTGIRDLGLDLSRRAKGRPIEALILLSHVHWDHYIGLPFFAPLYNDRNRFTVAGPRIMGKEFPAAIKEAIRPPYFPISTAEFSAKIDFANIGPVEYRYGDLRIVPHEAHHPQGSCGWRFYFKGGRSLVLMTDNEPRGAAEELSLVEFMRGSDALIHDSQYAPETYARRLGWGHSPYTYPIGLARAAGVKALYLTHFDPECDDAALRKMFAKARAHARSIGCRSRIAMAREGLSFSL